MEIFRQSYSGTRGDGCQAAPSTPASCISWNARRLGNQREFRELKRLAAERNPTFFFICETKMRDSNNMWWKKVLGYSGMFVVKCVGRRGGLILLWKASFEVTIYSYTSGRIDCIVQHEEKNMEIYELLRGGDFNEIYFDSEKIGRNIRPANQIRAYRDILDECRLHDLHGCGELFTWVNSRSSENIIFEPLDRYVETLE
ncbi:uncharacterized protein [Primulina eburnea]|uniref:uncharacterized protein n=1 Tax=Primulina eburnea TaxID=1245227 RepID=UPI003C6C2ADF